MRVAAAIVVLAGAGTLGACGTSDRDQVRAKIDQFATAAATRDYATICQQVLAPVLLERLAATGVSCEQAMRVAFGPVQDPTVSIGRIDVKGRTAEAVTLTAAKNQVASLDAIELTKTGNGWRISSLGSPSTSSGGK